MLHNVGKKIRILALALAALSLVLFLVLGIVCLSKASGEGVNEALKQAGKQAAFLSFAMAILLPVLMLIPYGFGCMVTNSEKRTEDMRETKELLKKALGEGLLADDIARQVGNTIGDRLQVVAAAPATVTNAPYQRPVEEPAEESATPATAPEKVTKGTKAEQQPRAQKPDGGALRPLRPVGTEESF